jgi:hypothetical protein
MLPAAWMTRKPASLTKSTTAVPVSFKITRPLAVVIDHTKADIFVLSEETQQLIRRPWLTLAMDVCNRIAASFCLRLRLRRGCRPALALHLVN